MKTLVLVFFVLLFSSCVSNQEVVQENKMKKVESSHNSEYSLNSKSDFKELVTDPITMDTCDKKDSIPYEGNFFCSQNTLNKYKEQK